MRQKVWRVPHAHPLTLRKETGKWYAFSMQWFFRIKRTCFLRVFRRFRAFYSSVLWCFGTHWGNWKICQKIAITDLFKLWLMVMKLHFSPRIDFVHFWGGGWRIPFHCLGNGTKIEGYWIFSFSTPSLVLASVFLGQKPGFSWLYAISWWIRKTLMDSWIWQ